RRLTPHRLHTTVRVQMEAVPARAVAGTALRPESVLAQVMNLIQVRVPSRARIEERVTGITMLFDREHTTFVGRKRGLNSVSECKRPTRLKCNEGCRGPALRSSNCLSARIRTGSGSSL